MTETNLRRDLMDEILSRKKMGDKKFHSESSLQQFDDDEMSSPESSRGPEVLIESITLPNPEEVPGERRRTVSQPGPNSGSMLTATAARMARRRPQRNVVYAASNYEMSPRLDRPLPRLVTPLRGDDSGSPTPTGDGFQYNGNNRNGDIKSLNSYRLYAPANERRGSTTPRKRSVITMDAQSLRSIETQAPPSTEPDENKRKTIESLTVILSCTYAIFLVTMGIIIYTVDPFDEGPSASAIYSVILTAMGFIYHVFLIFDISKYKNIALRNQKTKALHEEKIADLFRKQEEEYPNLPPDSPDIFKAANIPSPVLIPLNHDYCFSHGRHSGSFYLKLGATAFALGHLVHSILLIAVQIGYIIDDSFDVYECADLMQIVLDIINPIYCFYQLFFIFKYSNVIILKNHGLARFAFMHMIGSSICFWYSTIVRETVLALIVYAHSTYGNSDYDYTRTVSERPARFFNVSSLYNENCTGSVAITSIFENISPYLYPFSVEFNILIVGVYYIIWTNIGHCQTDSDSDESVDNSSVSDKYSVCKVRRIPTANEDNDFTSNIVIHADCHASNRGLFMGLVLTVIVAGMLIIGFVANNVGGTFLEIGHLLDICTSLALHTVMLVTSLFAYNQTRQLDINEHPISMLDDILLFVCLPAFFLEVILSAVATISLNNVIYTIDFFMMAYAINMYELDNIFFAFFIYKSSSYHWDLIITRKFLKVVQVIIQTALLVDGLRRCSNSRKLRRKKPGRELIIFLLIANVAMWLFNTFSHKSPESLDERYEYYGKVIWTVLGHISLPLIMFYRFHSSVCFADIWNSAYKPGSEH